MKPMDFFVMRGVAPPKKVAILCQRVDGTDA